MVSWPSATTVPSLGVTMPQMMLISVVLPAPLGPSSAKISPRRISRSMPFRAWKPDAKVLESCETEMMDGLEGSLMAISLLLLWYRCCIALIGSKHYDRPPVTLLPKLGSIVQRSNSAEDIHGRSRKSRVHHGCRERHRPRGRDRIGAAQSARDGARRPRRERGRRRGRNQCRGRQEGRLSLSRGYDRPGLSSIGLRPH